MCVCVWLSVSLSLGSPPPPPPPSAWCLCVCCRPALDLWSKPWSGRLNRLNFHKSITQIITVSFTHLACTQKQTGKMSFSTYLISLNTCVCAADRKCYCWCSYLAVVLFSSPRVCIWERERDTNLNSSPCIYNYTHLMTCPHFFPILRTYTIIACTFKKERNKNAGVLKQD